MKNNFDLDFYSGYKKLFILNYSLFTYFFHKVKIYIKTR